MGTNRTLPSEGPARTRPYQAGVLLGSARKSLTKRKIRLVRSKHSSVRLGSSDFVANISLDTTNILTGCTLHSRSKITMQTWLLSSHFAFASRLTGLLSSQRELWVICGSLRKISASYSALKSCRVTMDRGSACMSPACCIRHGFCCSPLSARYNGNKLKTVEV